jgi:integrase
MASIQKTRTGYRVRAAGVWRERPDGTRYRDRRVIASGVPTLREAKQIAAKEASPDYIAPHAMTCADQREAYVTSKASRSESHVRNLRQDLAKWWAPFDHIGLQQLGPEHLEDLRHRLETATGRNGRDPLSARQREAVWAATKACLNHAVRTRKIAWNPIEGVEPPAPPEFTDEDDTVREWDPEVIPAFSVFADLENIADDREHMLTTAVLLNLHLGLRPGELAALRWTDKAGNTVRVRRARSMVGGRRDIPVKQTKTGAGNRTVGMSGAAATMWVSLRARQAVASLDGYVFSHNGEPVHTGEIVRRFETLRDGFLAANPDVPRITFYGTRHTAITAWVRAGIKPEVVHKWAGHRKYSFTIERYYSTTNEEHEAAIAALC